MKCLRRDRSSSLRSAPTQTKYPGKQSRRLQCKLQYWTQLRPTSCPTPRTLITCRSRRVSIKTNRSGRTRSSTTPPVKYGLTESHHGPHWFRGISNASQGSHFESQLFLRMSHHLDFSFGWNSAQLRPSCVPPLWMPPEFYLDTSRQNSIGLHSGTGCTGPSRHLLVQNP